MKEKEPACRLCEEKWHSLEDQDVYEELQSAADFRAPMIAVTLQSYDVIWLIPHGSPQQIKEQP